MKGTAAPPGAAKAKTLQVRSLRAEKVMVPAGQRLYVILRVAGRVYLTTFAEPNAASEATTESVASAATRPGGSAAKPLLLLQSSSSSLSPPSGGGKSAAKRSATAAAAGGSKGRKGADRHAVATAPVVSASPTWEGVDRMLFGWDGVSAMPELELCVMSRPVSAITAAVAAVRERIRRHRARLREERRRKRREGARSVSPTSATTTTTTSSSSSSSTSSSSTSSTSSSWLSMSRAELERNGGSTKGIVPLDKDLFLGYARVRLQSSMLEAPESRVRLGIRDKRDEQLLCEHGTLGKVCFSIGYAPEEATAVGSPDPTHADDAASHLQLDAESCFLVSSAYYEPLDAIGGGAHGAGRGRGAGHRPKRRPPCPKGRKGRRATADDPEGVPPPLCLLCRADELDEWRSPFEPYEAKEPLTETAPASPVAPAADGVGGVASSGGATRSELATPPPPTPPASGTTSARVDGAAGSASAPPVETHHPPGEAVVVGGCDRGEGEPLEEALATTGEPEGTAHAPGGQRRDTSPAISMPPGGDVAIVVGGGGGGPSDDDGGSQSQNRLTDAGASVCSATLPFGAMGGPADATPRGDAGPPGLDGGLGAFLYPPPGRLPSPPPVFNGGYRWNNLQILLREDSIFGVKFLVMRAESHAGVRLLTEAVTRGTLDMNAVGEQYIKLTCFKPSRGGVARNSLRPCGTLHLCIRPPISFDPEEYVKEALRCDIAMGLIAKGEPFAGHEASPEELKRIAGASHGMLPSPPLHGLTMHFADVTIVPGVLRDAARELAAKPPPPATTTTTKWGGEQAAARVESPAALFVVGSISPSGQTAVKQAEVFSICVGTVTAEAAVCSGAYIVDHPGEGTERVHLALYAVPSAVADQPRTGAGAGGGPLPRRHGWVLLGYTEFNFSTSERDGLRQLPLTGQVVQLVPPETLQLRALEGGPRKVLRPIDAGNLLLRWAVSPRAQLRADLPQPPRQEAPAGPPSVLDEWSILKDSVRAGDPRDLSARDGRRGSTTAGPTAGAVHSTRETSAAAAVGAGGAAGGAVAVVPATAAFQTEAAAGPPRHAPRHPMSTSKIQLTLLSLTNIRVKCAPHAVVHYADDSHTNLTTTIAPATDVVWNYTVEFGIPAALARQQKQHVWVEIKDSDSDDLLGVAIISVPTVATKVYTRTVPVTEANMSLVTLLQQLTMEVLQSREPPPLPPSPPPPAAPVPGESVAADPAAPPLASMPIDPPLSLSFSLQSAEDGPGAVQVPPLPPPLEENEPTHPSESVWSLESLVIPGRVTPTAVFPSVPPMATTVETVSGTGEPLAFTLVEQQQQQHDQPRQPGAVSLLGEGGRDELVAAELTVLVTVTTAAPLEPPSLFEDDVVVRLTLVGAKWLQQPTRLQVRNQVISGRVDLNAYAIVTLTAAADGQSSEYRTAAVRCGESPLWYLQLPPFKPSTGDRITISVWDHDGDHFDEFLGETQLTCAELERHFARGSRAELELHGRLGADGRVVGSSTTAPRTVIATTVSDVAPLPGAPAHPAAGTSPAVLLDVAVEKQPSEPASAAPHVAEITVLSADNLANSLLPTAVVQLTVESEAPALSATAASGRHLASVMTAPVAKSHAVWREVFEVNLEGDRGHLTFTVWDQPGPEATFLGQATLRTGPEFLAEANPEPVTLTLLPRQDPYHAGGDLALLNGSPHGFGALRVIVTVFTVHNFEAHMRRRLKVQGQSYKLLLQVTDSADFPEVAPYYVVVQAGEEAQMSHVETARLPKFRHNFQLDLQNPTEMVTMTVKSRSDSSPVTTLNSIGESAGDPVLGEVTIPVNPPPPGDIASQPLSSWISLRAPSRTVAAAEDTAAHAAGVAPKLLLRWRTYRQHVDLRTADVLGGPLAVASTVPATPPTTPPPPPPLPIAPPASSTGYASVTHGGCPACPPRLQELDPTTSSVAALVPTPPPLPSRPAPPSTGVGPVLEGGPFHSRTPQHLRTGVAAHRSVSLRYQLQVFYEPDHVMVAFHGAPHSTAEDVIAYCVRHYSGAASPPAAYALEYRGVVIPRLDPLAHMVKFGETVHMIHLGRPLGVSEPSQNGAAHSIPTPQRPWSQSAPALRYRPEDDEVPRGRMSPWSEPAQSVHCTAGSPPLPDPAKGGSAAAAFMSMSEKSQIVLRRVLRLLNEEADGGRGARAAREATPANGTHGWPTTSAEGGGVLVSCIVTLWELSVSSPHAQSLVRSIARQGVNGFCRPTQRSASPTPDVALGGGVASSKGMECFIQGSARAIMLTLMRLSPLLFPALSTMSPDSAGLAEPRGTGVGALPPSVAEATAELEEVWGYIPVLRNGFWIASTWEEGEGFLTECAQRCDSATSGDDATGDHCWFYYVGPGGGAGPLQSSEPVIGVRYMDERDASQLA